MGKSGLSGLVKLLTLIPRLFVLGAKKIADRPGEMLVQFLKDLASMPKLFYLAGRATVRKFL